MILNHKCLECGFSGDVMVDEDHRKVICPCCGVVNDWWLSDEIPPEKHREVP
jgi:transcription initiation factor TFIIIB Brf1 subunit/transcription initiation factor TFIIB